MGVTETNTIDGYIEQNLGGHMQLPIKYLGDLGLLSPVRYGGMIVPSNYPWSVWSDHARKGAIGENYHLSSMICDMHKE